ncbi:zinc finger protein 831 isoform X2 [Hyperolius riggenbachi]|uniref:zinc finger protein 831 isoform X2 n=1 Tax=Hyperolius riggenbachi TaxID=752182 RepID=UPI0035A38521
MGSQFDLFNMEASNVASLSCTTAIPSGNHTTKPSTANDGSSTRALLLKGIGVPLYQINQQEGQQLPFQLASPGTSFAIDNGNLSVVLATQPQNALQKSSTQTLTLNIMNSVPVLSPNYPTSLLGTNPAKAKNTGKHICPHCGRDCLKPSVLEKHIRSHTGERPFPCTICGISFKTQSNLYKHRRTQTHVNNARQSFDSDCHEDQNGEQVGNGDNHCLDISKAVGDICIDKDQGDESKFVNGRFLVQEYTSIPTLLNADVIKNYNRIAGDSDHSSQAKDSTAILNQKRAIKEQNSATTNRHALLQRQSETCIDKQLDSSSSQRKLKKCESTDSGYLSHSDSAELQMFSGSPLHSLSECSFESEVVLNSGALDCEDKTSSKKNLEERISMLISKNKAVVDNTLLDNVRPRKTALSKQGSIDLPMPYTFKDSFHFDIKSLDANKNKVPLCSVGSTFTPPEKTKPLFFHSVPTQISSSIENVILARSNSLPFVENGKVQERFPARNTKSHHQVKQHLNVSLANLLLSNTATACTVDFSSSHPRGLVRQVAVDELPTSNAFESHVSEECKEVQPTIKAKPGNRKTSQKKMFSHEKWQMYGDETFKKFYQKIKKREQHRKTNQDLPDKKCESENLWPTPSVVVKPPDNILSPSLGTPPKSDLKATTSDFSPQILSKAISEINNGSEMLFPGDVHSVLSVEVEKRRPDLSSESPAKIHIGDQVCELQIQHPSPAKCPQISRPGYSYQSNVRSAKTETMLNEMQIELSVGSSKHGNMSDNIKGSLQYEEKSASENEGVMVEKINVNSIENDTEYSITDEIGQEKGKPNINTLRELPVCNDTHQGMTSISNNSLPYFGEVLEKATDPFSVHSSLSCAQTTTTHQENDFSPRYLINFHYIGSPVESSKTLQHETQISGVSIGETRWFDLPGCSKLKPSHQHSTAKQANLIQKHDSVIVPFSKINLNTERLSSNAPTVSIHVTQNVFLDARGRTEQKCKQNDLQPAGQSKLQELGDLPNSEKSLPNESIVSNLHCGAQATQQDAESKTMPSRCASPETTTGERPSHEKLDTKICKYIAANKQETTDGLQIGLTYSAAVKPVISQEQGSSSHSTTRISRNSGICNVIVTKVTFSTLNTEPKSTWCWLDKCLPLPAEQKEKSFSVYASLNHNSIKKRRPMQPSSPHSRIEDDSRPTSSRQMMAIRERIPVQPPPSHSRNEDDGRSTSSGQMPAITDRKPVQPPSPHSRSEDNGRPTPSRQTTAYPVLCKSLQLKDHPEDIKQSDAIKFQPLAKRMSRKGSQTKSKHIKRNKDRRRESPHSKVPHRMAKKVLRQEQCRRRRTCPTSSLKSGDILQRNRTLRGKDQAEKETSLNPPLLHSGVQPEKGDCRAGAEGQTNEETFLKIDTSSLVSPHCKVIPEEKYKSQVHEESVCLKIPPIISLNWQKSCTSSLGNEEATFDQVTSEIKRVHLQQDLVDGPPQKHGRKILQRSKTIGHSLGEESRVLNHNFALHNSALSLLPCSDPQPRTFTDAKEAVISPSSQNTREFMTGGCGSLDPKSDAQNLRKPTECDRLPFTRNITSHNQCDTSNLEQKDIRIQKKVNLEAMRKQTHVEYSDTSSDDEGRLYIEIERD